MPRFPILFSQDAEEETYMSEILLALAAEALGVALAALIISVVRKVAATLTSPNTV